MHVILQQSALHNFYCCSVLWFKPCWQLSPTELLMHSPCRDGGGIGRAAEKTVGGDKGSLIVKAKAVHPNKAK